MPDSTSERYLFLLLTLVCCAVITLGVAIRLSGQTPVSAPITLGHAVDADLVEIRDRAGATVLSGEFRSQVDTLGNTEKDAALFDKRGRVVIGEVEIEFPAPGRTDRRPELEVDIMGLRPRETFVVVVDDRVVGTFVTDDRGSIDMELQEGEVPPADH